MSQPTNAERPREATNDPGPGALDREDLGGRALTGHIGLCVRDLDRSVRFYEHVFGFATQGRSDEEGRSFAFLGTETDLILTLWQQADADYDPRSAGLHHLSFQVPSLGHVREAERRARQVGAPLHHGGVVAHGAGSASGGVYFDDPDGIRLEVFTADGLHGAPAPSGEAPTCGFF